MKLMRQAINQLQSSNLQEAARLFLESYQRELLPQRMTTPKQLRQIVSQNHFSRLISALAHLSCFCCRKGMAKCDNCQGKGQLGNEDICEACLGLGVISCKFCGGTGWIPLEDLPAGLIGEILKQRLNTAVHRIRAILESSAKDVSLENPHSQFKERVNEFFALHRQLSVLETNLTFLTTSARAHPTGESQLTKIHKLSMKMSIKIWHRIRQLMHDMAEILFAEAQGANPADKRKLRLTLRARFYQSLYESFDYFKGTEWEHPLLYQVVRKVRPHHYHKPSPKKEKNSRQQPDMSRTDITNRSDAVTTRAEEKQRRQPHDASVVRNYSRWQSDSKTIDPCIQPEWIRA